jgi:hypothetical protein
MKNNIDTFCPRNLYLRQFQIAQLNLAIVIEEERVTKRLKNSRKKTRTND